MTVRDDIIDNLRKNPLHFALLDPDKQKPEKAGNLAKYAENAGSSAIMVIIEMNIYHLLDRYLFAQFIHKK